MAAARQGVLGAALVATLAASVWTLLEPPPAEEGDLVSAAAPRTGASPAARAAAPAPAPAPAPVDRQAVPAAPVMAGGPRWTSSDGNLFATRRWEPPAAARGNPGSSEPQLPPAPPELPFRYLGKLVDGTQVVAFLAKGNDVLLARKGDVLAGWRVDDLRVDGMRLTHVVRAVHQDLVFGSSN
jgi:hypothetical protein